MPRPGAAVTFGHRDAEPAALGHGVGEFERELAVGVASEPVIIAEALHEAPDVGSDLVLDWGGLEVHWLILA